VLFFELFPVAFTIVATAIAVALYVVSRRRRGRPERPLEHADPSRASKGEGRPIPRSSMRG
jgi:hypothetical protein